MRQLPTQARIVIIGGGIVGCSTAYHLTQIGHTDVVLLERREIGCGTTWAAAGLVAQLRQNREMTNLAKYATQLYPALEAETGVATGYVTTGALGVCQTEDRRREWLRGSAMASAFGIEMHEISLKEAEDMVPGMSTQGLVSVFYLPNDGQTNPLETTRSLIKGARMRGAKVCEDTAVTGITVKHGAVCGVTTDRGDIACEIVINCAGIWGREVGRMVDVSVPLYSAEHMHVVTQPIQGLKKVFPCVRDFDGRTYFKAENGALLFGGFEAVAKPWGMKGIPRDLKFTEITEDWEQFNPFMECGLQRFPGLETAEIRHFSNVPESFTPDNAFMVGEAPGIRNFFVGCGMNSVGIASAAGVGRALAQWVDQGYPEEHLWPVDIRRVFPLADELPLPARPREWNPWASCTSTTSPTASAPRPGRSSALPSTTVWPRTGPASACSPAGSAPTGSRRKASSRCTGTAGAGPTGSPTRGRSTWPCARPSGCTT